MWGRDEEVRAVPPVAIANVVQSMQRVKKDTPEILRELQSLFQKHSGHGSLCAVNDLHASLGKRLDLEPMQAVVHMLPALGMAADQQTYEILLTTNYAMRNFSGVRALLAEMKRTQVPRTVRTSLVLLKKALKTNNWTRRLRSSGSFGLRGKMRTCRSLRAPAISLRKLPCSLAGRTAWRISCPSSWAGCRLRTR